MMVPFHKLLSRKKLVLLMNMILAREDLEYCLQVRHSMFRIYVND